MAEKKKGKGRPKGSRNLVEGQRINKEEFERLCFCHCTIEEICFIYSTCYQALDRWCKVKYQGASLSECYAKFSSNGNASLRSWQFQQAEKNPVMAIWMGKQYLNQRDLKEDETAQQHITIVNNIPDNED